jgi:hypothetical protein
MTNINAVLSARTKKSEQSSKMSMMAQQSANGHLSSFAGIFSVCELTHQEKNNLENLLKEYAQDPEDIAKDLDSLISITCEVKAINNQAAILHGERIKKAHTILTHYKEGAFTAWLIATYGNRQTPYNLMQYYEFHESIPKHLRPQLEAMPRQAIYTLASRSGSLEQKMAIIEKYQGQTKNEILQLIRQTFPLAQEDKRQQKLEVIIRQSLNRLAQQLKEIAPELNRMEKRELLQVVEYMRQLLK